MESELSIPGIQEISRVEQQGINGGIWPIIVSALAGAIVTEILRDWDNFKNGLLGRPEEK